MSKQILFIDDEPEFISQHKSALIRSGFSVDEALTYEEALSWLKTKTYDLIILDLIIARDNGLLDVDDNEPDVEIGLSLHREIREKLRISKTPILFFSVVNDALVFQRIQAIEERFSIPKINYLPKPKLPSRLVAQVLSLIS